LFEKAIASPSQNSMNQIQYSPVVKLVESYANAGRRDEARDLLMKQLKSSSVDNYDAGYASYQQFENKNWVAGKLLEMKFPVDAIRMYRQLLDQPDALASAQQYSGRDAEYHVKTLRKGMADAVALMDGSNANEMVSQLMAASETSDSGSSVIDLMLVITDAKELANEPMKSSFVELLITLSKDPQVSSAITDRLISLAEQFPHDISVAIASTMWKLKAGDEGAGQAVRQLAAIASDKPLEEIAEGRRPNSRQRRQAAMMIPLWLVARECFKQDELNDIGQQLADVALQAARRQIGFKEQSAILYDWGKMLIEMGNKADAELRWAELLDLATQRPQRTIKPDEPKASSRQPQTNNVALIPPLTLSQFRMAVLIAKSAAENGMSQLSRRAVSESLKGGFPVADPVSTKPNDMASQMIVPSPTSREQSDPIEYEVISSLKQIVLLWTGNDYPDEDTYQVLKALVLPANRPMEIMMYFAALDDMDAKIDSLAFQLALAAKRSNRLPELLEAVNQRLGNAATAINAMTLKTLIAVEQKNVDESVRLLIELTAQVDKGTAASLHVAFMAALHAFENDDLKAAAFPIMRQTLQRKIQVTSTNTNSELKIDGKLASLVNTFLASTGDEQSVKDYFDSVLLGRQAYYSRLSGDSGLYQQMRDMATITGQAAELRMPNLTLDFLGRTCDFELPNYPRPSLPTPLAIVRQQLKSLSAAERYDERRTWTMPALGRETIRFLAEPTNHSSVPKVFLEQAGYTGTPDLSVLLSNFTELVRSANDARTLGQLRTEVDALVVKKFAHAELLQTLTMIAQNDIALGTKNVEELLASMNERLKPGESRVRPSAAGEYLVYQACLASESFAPLFENRLPAFRKQLMDASQTSYAMLANVDWANRATTVTKRSDWPLNSPFEHWLVTSSESVYADQKSWWAGYEGQITRLSGRSSELLFCRYPLAGDFTVSMDCLGESLAEGSAGYGGITVNPSNRFTTEIRSASGHDSITDQGGMRRERPGVDRLAIQVNDGQTKFFVNKYLVYQEAIGTTSPWLTLGSDGARVTSFRNIRIAGSPIIPRQVELFSANRMDGWDCTKFNESQPRNRLMAEKTADVNDPFAYNSYNQQQEPTLFDWSVEDGVLSGRVVATSAESAQQSWLYYHRPLQNRDSFQYEFYYVPGKSVAHPTIGRIALLLEPAGVTTHWIATPKWDDSYYGVKLDNSIIEKSCRRGPESLPLKADDWNRVELTLRDGVAVVSLNGSVVFERPLDAELSTRFGVFRLKQQSTKVRNAVLTGDWPTELSDHMREDMAALAEPTTAEQLRVIATIVDDATIEPLAADVVRTARNMPPEQAFEQLQDWVLPSASHRNLRLYYALDNPAADSTTSGDKAIDADSSVPTTQFDEILCPAVELVRVANAAGKLDELEAMVEQLSSDDALLIRNRQALKALIAIESDDQEATKLALTEVWRMLVAGLPQELSAANRAAEFLVAWRAAQKSEFRTTASDIVRELRESERDEKRRSNNETFLRHVNTLFGDIELAMRSSQPSKSSSLGQARTQWTQVPYVKPELKAQGYRPSTWIAAKGSLQHIPAETWSQLYFQSPLRGQFEILAEHSTLGHREVSVAWGMHAAQPRHDLSATQVTKLMHQSKNVGVNLTLPTWDAKAETRIRVDGNKVTTWTNGVQIHEEAFDSPPDPWLVLQAAHPTNYATINNLRIIGTPEIPSEINLIDMAGWAAWRADVYGESHSTSNVAQTQTPWKRVGDELTGGLRKGTAAEHLESLLLYQRPMLEDGVIEFESWYEPGTFEVHPALGPDAFLISPSGIGKHCLTNAQYETSDLQPGNEEPVPSSAASVPLKEKDWNQIRLTLKGDSLTISVNGEDVASIAVTVAASDRQFGLFRYSNKTQCRVRKLVYRGDWPKTLPPVDEQELAYSADGPFALSDGTPVFDESLNQPLEKLKAKGISGLGPADRMTVRDEGLRISLHDSNGYPTWPGIARWTKVAGDLEVTVDYRDLEMSPVKEGWGNDVGLHFSLSDSEKTRVDCVVSLNKESQLVYKTQLARTTLDGTNKTYDQILISNAPKSGRLRMIRKGGQIHCLVAPTGSVQFRLLASFAVGDSEVSSITFQGKCSDSAGRADITLERLTIREKSPADVSK